MFFFRNKKLFIVFLGIIVLIALIGYSLTSRDQLTTPEQFVKDTVGWTQQIFYVPIHYVRDTYTNLKELKNTFDENKILKEKIAEYRTLIYEVQQLKKENENLRKILDKTETMRDYQAIQAMVIARSPEKWYEQVTINKGSQHGVERNMAVITADGMIGKVQHTSQFTSTVQLLTGFDQFNRISAMISKENGKNIFGLVEEYDVESHSLLFKMIDEYDEEVEEGDLVVSSGLGGLFPAGLFIGTVKEVHPDEYGLTQTAKLEPAADMYEINHVIVVDPKIRLNDAEEQDGED